MVAVGLLAYGELKDGRRQSRRNRGISSFSSLLLPAENIQKKNIRPFPPNVYNLLRIKLSPVAAKRLADVLFGERQKL